MFMEGIIHNFCNSPPDSFLIIMLVLLWLMEKEYKWNTTEIEIKLYLKWKS